MKGKPKGIRRKVAAGKASIEEKLALSEYGDVGDFPAEVKLYEDARFVKWLRDSKNPNHHPSKWVDQITDDVAQQLAQSMIDAVCSNDADFFDRMAAIARHHKNNSAPVDEKAKGILIAVQALRHLKKNPTAAEVIRFLTEHDERCEVEYPPDYDERDIRRVIRDLGI